MKFYISLLAIILSNYLTGQNLFSITIEQDQVDHFDDVMEVDGHFYFLQKRAFNVTTFESDSYSEIVETDESGNLINIYPLSSDQSVYHRIVKSKGDHLILIGQVKEDSCKWKFVISQFNIHTHVVEHLSSKDYCGHTIQKIKIVEGLDGKIFIEEAHSVGSLLAKHVHEMDSLYNLTLVLDSVSPFFNLSIDFSRKGYLVSNDLLKRFYDRNFNFRKQKQFYEDVDSENETHRPFGKSYILLQTMKSISGERDEMQVFVIDSALRVIKENIIRLPDGSPNGFHYPPWYGGMEMRNDNEIWVLGSVQPTPPYDPPTGFYYFARLDSNLQIVCQHFLGYDTWYRMYGMRLLDSGGAILFGNRHRIGFPIVPGDLTGLDVFALRVGQNCELPLSVAVDGIEHPLMAISAYPNPGHNELTLDVHGFDPSLLHMELIDINGQVLFSALDLSNQIHLPDLPVGQYFYRVLKQDELLAVGSWLKQ